MANYNNDNVRVYGSLDDFLAVAPVGTVLPDSPEAITAPWVKLGWLSEDGVPIGVSTDVEKFKGHQGGTTIRTKVTSTEKTISFTALEDSPVVAKLYWDASDAVETSPGSGVYRVDTPEGIGTVAVAAVAYFKDGDTWKMYCYEKIEIGEREEVSHANAEISGFGMSAEIIGDSYFLTNSPAYAPEDTGV